MLIKDVRMAISDDKLKNIMGRMGIFPVRETEQAIIFPTYCHNTQPKEGSDKLYYYKDEKIFKCYTECKNQFDVFEMIIKVNKLRGDQNYGLRQALDFANVYINQTFDQSIHDDLVYLANLNKPTNIETDEITIRDMSILENFPYDSEGVKSWIKEGITEEAMKKFKIGYHNYLNGITIPAFDNEGHLVGVRIRFLNEDSKIKYMPLKVGFEYMNFPTGKFLYGTAQNKKAIQKIKKAIIFEGEKSVLKMEDYFPGMNFSVATFGKRLGQDHLNTLVKLGVEEAILAYDKDYTNNSEFTAKFEEYKETAKILKGYMNVSIVMDLENNLDYQDSPADKGKEVFEKLLNSRQRI